MFYLLIFFTFYMKSSFSLLLCILQFLPCLHRPLNTHTTSHIKASNMKDKGIKYEGVLSDLTKARRAIRSWQTGKSRSGHAWILEAFYWWVKQLHMLYMTFLNLFNPSFSISPRTPETTCIFFNLIQFMQSWFTLAFI